LREYAFLFPGPAFIQPQPEGEGKSAIKDRPKTVILVFDKGNRGPETRRVPMAKDDLGRYVVELNETAAVLVEQIADEITVVIASVVNVHF
jgi:hypothetical protein